MKAVKDNRRLNIISKLLHELGYCSVTELQHGHGLHEDGIFGNQTYAALYKELLNPIQVPFEGNYFPAEYNKKQIVIHHTAGWDNARGVFEWWTNDKVKHVATAVAVNDAGELYKGFSEDFWAHHLGCKSSHFNKFSLTNINTQLNKASVALEICNWGQLTKEGGKFYNYLGKEVTCDVTEVSYRGFNYFESITDKEVDTVRKWVLLMAIRFDIPLDYNDYNLWNVNADALSGKAGVYTHGSFRDDKVDVYPHPEIVKMLKTLKDYE